MSDFPAWVGVRRPLTTLVLAALASVSLSACCATGVSRYLQRSKEAEARANLGTIARGMVYCATQPGKGGAKKGLPPSSNSVPAALFEVSGKKYSSTRADWTNPAWQCAKLELTTSPQYFQYRWELVSPSKGVAHADGDLNGDGKVDSSFEMAVECNASGDCTPGPLVEK